MTQDLSKALEKIADASMIVRKATLEECAEWLDQQADKTKKFALKGSLGSLVRLGYGSECRAYKASAAHFRSLAEKCDG